MPGVEEARAGVLGDDAQVAQRVAARGDLPLARGQQPAADPPVAAIRGHPEVLDPVVVGRHDADDPAVDLGEEALRPVAVRPRRVALEQMAVDLAGNAPDEPLDRGDLARARRPDHDVAERRRRGLRVEVAAAQALCFSAGSP